MASNPADATLSSPGFASIKFICIGVDYGTIQIAQQDEGRDSTALYVHKVTEAPVAILIHHSSREEYVSFNEWLLRYIRSAATSEVNTEPITITVPAFSLVRQGIPISASEFGDQTAAFSYQQTVVFESAAEYLGVGNALPSNTPSLPTNPDLAAHYPTSPQLKGFEHVQNSLFDAPAIAAAQAAERAWYKAETNPLIGVSEDKLAASFAAGSFGP